MSAYLRTLECSRCGHAESPGRLHNLCPRCGAPLLARYDLDAMARRVERPVVGQGEATLWRYFDLLPVESRESAVSLGEGWTPLLPALRAGAETPASATASWCFATCARGGCRPRP